MASTLIVKPLGLVLQKAGLVSPEQVQTALEARTKLPNYKFGEILATQGWIDQKTADFFAEQWPKIINSQLEQPLGQYFKAAGLMDEEQIASIVKEQPKTGLKFGAAAVVKGIISQTTLDFFLEHLKLNQESSEINCSSPQQETRNLTSIANYLLHNQNCEPTILLQLYAQLWQQKTMLATGSQAETELLHSGLVIKQHNKIEIAQDLYQKTFDRYWIEQELARLQPYSKIRLKLFGLETKASLPYRVLTEVRYWTNNQPYLTQKIYQIIQQQAAFIPQGKEAEMIEDLVQTYILDNWRTASATEHLCQLEKEITEQPDRLFVRSVLKAYKKIWQQREVVSNDSSEQLYLLEIGLVRQKHHLLSVANRIYQTVFDRTWLEQQLSRLNQLEVAQEIIVDSSRQRIDEQLKSPRLFYAGVSSVNSSSLTTDNNPPQLLPDNNLSPDQLLPQNKYSWWEKILTLLLVSSICLLGFNVLKLRNMTQAIDQTNQLRINKDFTQALANYEQLLQTNHFQTENLRHQLWLNRGYTLAGLQQYEQMWQSCTSATIIQPQSALAWNCRGEAYYHLEQYRQATQAFAKSTELNAQEPVFWLNRSEALYKLKHYQQAYLTATEAVKLLETNKEQNRQSTNGVDLPLAYNLQAKALLKQTRYAEALATYKRSLVYSPNYLSAQQGMGIALQNLGDYQQAETVFESILQREDLSEDQQAITWLYRGINYCDAQNFIAANYAFQQVLQFETELSYLAIAKAGCGLR